MDLLWIMMSWLRQSQVVWIYTFFKRGYREYLITCEQCFFFESVYIHVYLHLAMSASLSFIVGGMLWKASFKSSSFIPGGIWGSLSFMLFNMFRLGMFGTLAPVTEKYSVLIIHTC